MTRASLLHLLAHPTALTGPDVRALEELAQAFPYCQTAHLLLAKAAHDEGSMLAAQRLRRAATYAADRTRLRQLIEAPAVVALAEVAVAEELAAPWLSAAPGSALPPAAAGNGFDIVPVEPVEPSDVQPTTQLEDKPDQLIAPAEVAAQSAAPAPLADAELPAQAPPIRPPAEAGVARFEFGLADEEPAQIMAYRLAGLAEPAPGPALDAPPATPRLPPFGGVADVGYAASEGSRLGFCLVAAEAEWPGASLPPVSEFFAPDALLLAHLAAHQLLGHRATPAKPSPLDLINSFLQRTPAAPRRRILPASAAPDDEAQADLSVRSTRAEPDLASENLARILARQGKNERAIAVYERLMVKHPEKMAYFATQIESLRPSA